MESGTLNHWAECQAAVGRLTSNVAFLEKRKGKEDLTRPISSREPLWPCDVYADDVVVNVRVHLDTPADNNLFIDSLDTGKYMYTSKTQTEIAFLICVHIRHTVVGWGLLCLYRVANALSIDLLPAAVKSKIHCLFAVTIIIR